MLTQPQVVYPWVQSIPAPLREALACHEMLRRLGFQADDIYLVAAPDPQGMVALQLRVGELHFSYATGVQQMSHEVLAQKWQAAVRLWNHDFTSEECWALFKSSQIAGRLDEVLATLRKKGFPLPDWTQVPTQILVTLERLIRGAAGAQGAPC
jgi:hypothetical protein